MDNTIEESMQFKLNEARFFYEHMRELDQSDDKLHFTYYFSAFSSALRSVLQYACEYDKKKYQKHLSNVSFKDYFKEIRDLNVHKKPLTVSKLQKVEIPSVVRVIVKPTVNEKQLNETSIEELIEQKSIELKFEESSEPVKQSEYFIGEKQVENFIEYSLIDISQNYIDEVEQFIESFLNEGNEKY